MISVELNKLVLLGEGTIQTKKIYPITFNIESISYYEPFTNPEAGTVIHLRDDFPVDVVETYEAVKIKIDAVTISHYLMLHNVKSFKTVN